MLFYLKIEADVFNLFCVFFGTEIYTNRYWMNVENDAAEPLEI